MSDSVSEVTRRAVIDYFSASEIKWWGRLEDHEFLARLYDLTILPSTDHRINTARGDIIQHRSSFHDWEDDWVFFDSRFNLLRCPDEEFLRFLCETVHPVVRPDVEEARQLVDGYNDALKSDGWRLIERRQISGHPVFVAEKLGERIELFEEPTGWGKVDRQLQEVRFALDTAQTEERYQTVGLLCREVLISVAESAFNPALHKPTDGLTPSRTDAGRMLEALFDTELRGSANEEARAHAKAALRLALALQHKRTADFRIAALCAEATASVVQLVAIVSGRRG